MESKARIGGHPIHPMLIPFPLALWTTSFAADVLYYFSRNLKLLFVAKFLIAAGILGAAAAAIPGIIDWAAIKDREAKRVANWHGRINIVALIVFCLSLYFRLERNGDIVGHRLTIPFLLSLVGVILISISGYLGGDLAYRYGIGVSLKGDAPVE
ncbi:MAG: hypothetical protein QOD75_3696 [Blastocatellia bacterium]|nr:hypothetical protein [Blastocatellia bacterium]